MAQKILCPVCEKTTFGKYCDNSICKYCGWENDDNYESGGANIISLADYKIRYNKYTMLYNDYIWKKDGLPDINLEDECRLAHNYSFINKQSITNSTLCGCFYCCRVFKAEEVTDWIAEDRGQTACCPYCGIDSVIPDSDVCFDHTFLEEMKKIWF